MSLAALFGLASSGVPKLQADYASTVTGLNPVAYYRLNTTNAVPIEYAATNRGSLGVAFHGAYRNMAVSRGIPGAIVGDPSTAVFASGGSSVVVPHASSYNPSGAFSVEAWLKPSSDTVTLSCALNSGHMADPRSGWILYQNGSEGWVFRMYNQNGLTTSLELTGGSPLATNVWGHVAVTYDGTTATLYVNGAAAATGQPSGTPSNFVPNTDGPFVIGARSDFAYPWSGAADEVAVYTSMLSAADVLAHYQSGTNAGRTESYSTLVLTKNPALYLRLDEPSLQLPVAANSGSYGTAADGHFLPGTVSQVPSLQKQAAPGFESTNVAAGFNGTSGSVQIPGQSLTTDTATFVAWVKREGTQPARAGIIHNRGSSTLATGLGLHDDGISLSYNWEDKGDAYNYNPGFVLPDRTWTFVAVSVTAENAVLYMGSAKGLQASTNNYANGPHDFSGATLEIGWDNYAATRIFNGAIDEIAVWDKALTYDQISNLFSAALPAILGVNRSPADPVYEGSSVTFQATASSTNVTYQWRKNGLALAGQTSATLTLNNLAQTDTGDYDVTVVTGGQTLTSLAEHLEVQFSPPIIEKAPVSAVRFLNGRLVFAATIKGSAPLSVQWKHGASVLPGETLPSLTLTDLQPSDAGEYTLVVTNPYGTKEATASLSLATPTKLGSAITDLSPVGYWRLDETGGSVAYDYWGGTDGTANAGATNSVPGPRPTAQPGFDATNTAYQFDGSSGKVVIPALNLNRATATIVAWINPNGAQADYAGVVFSRGSAVSGLDYKGTTDQLGYHWNDAASTYNWESGLSPVQGQWNFVALVVEPTQATLYLDSGSGLTSSVNTVDHGTSAFDGTVQIAQDGTSSRLFKGGIDDVAIWNRALSESEIQALRAAGFAGTYTAKPIALVQQPKSQTIMAGSSRVLSVTVSGSVPITYQWQKNGQDIPGATRSQLSLAQATEADTGIYRVVVTQGTRTLTSSEATLTVKPVPTHLNIPQDLVLHLKFDASYQDSSGRTNHGTAVGQPKIVSGKVGTGALQYSTVLTDGEISAANYVTLGTPADLQFGASTSFSVAFWTKFSGGLQDLPFLCNNVDSYGGAGFVFAPSYGTGSWSWSLNDGASPLGWPGAAAQYGNDAGYANTLNDGEWHHLAFLIDRTGDVATYVDGKWVHSKSIQGLAFNPDTGLSINIGQGANADYKVGGTVEMDDLGIWRRALSEYEAQAIYVVGSQYGRSFDSEGPATVTLAWQRAAMGITLTWSTGTLEAADDINGTWSTVTGAAAPSYTVTPTGVRKFYRVRVP